ncbi:hypothetical protein GW17_00040440 [Ensete ventricosum]|nr:hypothetical protein GW17_00040440 [Ensete ventricosum]
MLASTDADGGLPVSVLYVVLYELILRYSTLTWLYQLFQSRPHLRFNKKGNLLAVATVDNGFKILANADGLAALRAFGNRSFEPFRAQHEAAPIRVTRLLYTNSGVGLLALGSNAIQRLWKWSRNEQNPTGKALFLPREEMERYPARGETSRRRIGCFFSLQRTSRCELVYASFCDGNIGVFDADNLRLRCRIALSAYTSPAAASSNPPTCPLVIAAHPQEPNQFAVGLTDGTVKVIEPLKSEGRWGAPTPVDNGVHVRRTQTLSTTSNPAADQPQR